MQVTASSQTTYTAQAQSVKNSDQTASAAFDISSLKDKDPKDITFEEYKNLSREDIQTLYPKETHEDFYETALSLHIKATGTSDETLNQVMFEKELKSNGSEHDKKTSQMINRVISDWESIEKFKISLEKTLAYIENNDIQLSKNPDQWIQEFSQLQSEIYKETVVPDHEKKISKDELFEVFEYNKQGAQTLIDIYGYSPKEKQYRFLNSAIDYEQIIKEEYEKRTAQKEALLQNYTSRNSATSKAVLEQKQQKIEKTHIKEEFETMEKLLEDIKSLFKTGFTVEELEHIEKLIKQIQKLINENNSGNDKEIAKRIQELKDQIMQLQKRVNGNITEADESNSNSSKQNDIKIDPNGFQKELDVIKQSLEKMKNGMEKDKEKLIEDVY